MVKIFVRKNEIILFFSAICRTNFEANEGVKKLECGHLFHTECVAHWLSITRICPVCRQRMSSAT
jgi:hypothetical protein